MVYNHIKHNTFLYNLTLFKLFSSHSMSKEGGDFAHQGRWDFDPLVFFLSETTGLLVRGPH